MVQNGDLWQAFLDAATARGPTTLAVKWVKGHAKQEHIDQGLLTQAEAHGNKNADLVADEGVRMHPMGAMELAKLFLKG